MKKLIILATLILFGCITAPEDQKMESNLSPNGQTPDTVYILDGSENDYLARCAENINKGEYVTYTNEEHYQHTFKDCDMVRYLSNYFSAPFMVYTNTICVAEDGECEYGFNKEFADNNIGEWIFVKTDTIYYNENLPDSLFHTKKDGWCTSRIRAVGQGQNYRTSWKWCERVYDGHEFYVCKNINGCDYNYLQVIDKFDENDEWAYVTDHLEPWWIEEIANDYETRILKIIGEEISSSDQVSSSVKQSSSSSMEKVSLSSLEQVSSSSQKDTNQYQTYEDGNMYSQGSKVSLDGNNYECVNSICTFSPSIPGNYTWVIS